MLVEAAGQTVKHSEKRSSALDEMLDASSVYTGATHKGLRRVELQIWPLHHVTVIYFLEARPRPENPAPCQG